MILAGTLASSCAQQSSLRDDPGFDDSTLHPSYQPLKGRMALRYHLAEKGGAPQEDRVALAHAFTHLQSYEQCALLGELWPRAQCREFQPVLEALLHLPKGSEQDGPEQINDLIMERLIDLGSLRARKMLLSDIRTGYPHFATLGLRSLPEQDLPELDAAFSAHLTRIAPPHGACPCDLSKISFVVGRYGSPALLDAVKALYSSSDGGWACDIQAGLLRYLIKHDPDYGLAKLERALLSRGQDGKNNCYSDAIYETIHGLQGKEITAFAMRQLSADRSEIRFSAARYLMETSEPSIRGALIRMAIAIPGRKVKRDAAHDSNVRDDVLDLVLLRPAFSGEHLPSPNEINQLKAGLSEVEKAYYQRAIDMLRATLD